MAGTVAVVNKLWRTILGYVWWTYPRGSVHYDVMVTLILAFIFLAPLWLNFNDKPTERKPHQTGVVVIPDGTGFIYQIDAAAVRAAAHPGCGVQDNAAVRDELLRVIEPIAGEVEIASYEAVCDSGKRVQGYRVKVERHLVP